MNTNNQYCSSDGVVSTAWTYVEAYDSMPPPMTTMPPPMTTMPPPPPSTAPAGDGGHYGGSEYDGHYGGSEYGP